MDNYKILYIEAIKLKKEIWKLKVYRVLCLLDGKAEDDEEEPPWCEKWAEYKDVVESSMLNVFKSEPYDEEDELLLGCVEASRTVRSTTSPETTWVKAETIAFISLSLSTSGNTIGFDDIAESMNNKK